MYNSLSHGAYDAPINLLEQFVVVNLITGELKLRVKRDLHIVNVNGKQELYFVVEDDNCRSLVHVDKYDDTYEFLEVL